MREFIVETDMDLNGVVEFEGAGGVSFKPKGEIIRCKDCRFYEENYMGRMVCIDSGMVRNSNDFCSRAVGKEE